MGWLAEQIVLVDVDLGVSGRFGSERDGYRQIVARLCMGEVPDIAETNPTTGRRRPLTMSSPTMMAPARGVGAGCGQAWSVGMIHSSLMAVWRGRVTM